MSTPKMPDGKGKDVKSLTPAQFKVQPNTPLYEKNQNVKTLRATSVTPRTPVVRPGPPLPPHSANKTPRLAPSAASASVLPKSAKEDKETPRASNGRVGLQKKSTSVTNMRGTLQKATQPAMFLFPSPPGPTKKGAINNLTPIMGRRSAPAVSSPSSAFLEPHTPETQSRHSEGGAGFVSPSWECDDAAIAENAESTAVSVGVRVRPLNAREIELAGCRLVIEMSGNQVLLSNEAGAVQSFAFDHCFWSCEAGQPQYASQRVVYNTMAKPLLDKAFTGYNVTLLAYGQTGSGKSYCMVGEDRDDLPVADQEKAGIIPRFCRELFDRAAILTAPKDVDSSHVETNVEVEVYITYIEIYNEKIYDLLEAGKSSEKREALRVRKHPLSGPYVEGASKMLVDSYQSLRSWMEVGNKNRSIAATGMNDKSSRSHAVFTLTLTQTQVERISGDLMRHSRVSIINLVDLAGSERVAATFCQGERLKEGICINQSLLTLGKVITALADSKPGRRAVCIPYRESVLTFLLQESLGGNSRTAMIATVSPAFANLEETLSTLRYAAQARKIINVNRVNEDPAAAIIRSLKAELELLRAQQLGGLSGSPFRILLNGSQMNESDKEEEMRKKEAEITALQDKLLELQQCMDEKNNCWVERWREAEDQRRQALEKLERIGLVTGKDILNRPTLVNLCEDAQLTETLSYALKEGSSSLGRVHCDITLRGLTGGVHCTIFNDEGQLMLYPKQDMETYLNGVNVTSVTQLNHDDRLVLGGHYFFRVRLPIAEGSPNASRGLTNHEFDFFFAKEELLKVQEKRFRSEQEAAQQSIREEMEAALRHQKEQFLAQLQEADGRNVEALDLLESERQKSTDLCGETQRLEQENRQLAEQLSRQKKCSETLIESPDLFKSNFLEEVEAMFSDQMISLKRNSTKVNPLIASYIKEGNQILSNLKKPFELSIQPVLSKDGMETSVVIHDNRHDLYASCTAGEFMRKMTYLRDVVANEHDESTDMFEMDLDWRRSAELTRVPAFVKRLEKLSSSSSPAGISKGRLSFGSLGAPSPCRTLATVSHGMFVAQSCHRLLTEEEPLFQLDSVHGVALVAARNGYHAAQCLIDDLTSTASEERLVGTLMTLTSSVQSLKSVLPSLSLWVSEKRVIAGIELGPIDEELKRLGNRVVLCTSKLMQGVRADSVSLVSDETAALTKLFWKVTKILATHSVCAGTELPDVTKWNFGAILSRKFILGLGIGLETIISATADLAKDTAEILSNARDVQTRLGEDFSPLLLFAASAAEDLAKFMRDFSQLSVTAGVNTEWSDWVYLTKKLTDRIRPSVDNVVHISQTLSMLKNLTTKNDSSSNLVRLLQAVKSMQGQLRDLRIDAGIYMASSPIKSGSTSSNEDFMDGLYSLAAAAASAVDAMADELKAAVKGRKIVVSCASEFTSPMPVGEPMLGPFGSVRRTPQKTPGRKSQWEKTPRDGSEEGKRVRFDVTDSLSQVEPEIL